MSLVIDRDVQSFTFTGVGTPPVPSLFRTFSAPVKVTYNYRHEDLLFLFTHDSDPFNRYAFHVRASYFDETAEIVKQVTSVGIKRIGVFHQNDSYGQAGLEGLVAVEDVAER